MIRWAMPWKRVARHLAVALLVGSAGVFGCGKSEPPKAQTSSNSEPEAPAPAVHNDEKPKIEKAPAPSKEEPADDGLHHSFASAVRKMDSPPVGCSVPAVTAAGKSVYKIYNSVASQWDGIRFTHPDGRRVHYSATIVTTLGEIEIELRPDLAPNHVRSFVALARAGYYDHLFFDHVNHEEYPENPGVRNDFLEAGCPLIGADDGYDSVGYWLYPETKPAEKATHVEGTVGAMHGMEKDSAGCKFYISLSKAPFNDTHYTIFGNVTRGLDVVQKIFAQPIAAEDRGRFGCLRPENPVMIQKVIINYVIEEAKES